ncbi:MAG: hypothetical protein C0485_00630 [Pirellula sp.]|nr:hypothetical protein [Pirellula sp.]
MNADEYNALQACFTRVEGESLNQLTAPNHRPFCEVGVVCQATFSRMNSARRADELRDTTKCVSHW